MLDQAQTRNERLRERWGETYKWLAGTSVVVGLLTAIFSSTMINVALTDVMATFNITQGMAQWLSTAFLCASSVTMLSNAWAMSTFGSRITFLFAILVFLAGSLLGWQSTNFWMLIVGRVLQGVGAGILQPLSMALVFLLFPENMRGRAMGMFGMGVVIGPALGPIVGGFITDALDWHTTFAVVIPLAMMAGVLGFFLLPDKSGKLQQTKLNAINLAIITLAAGCLLTGLSNSQFFPLGSLVVYPYLLIALLAFTLFLIRELKSNSPLVNLNLFKDLRITSSAIIGALNSAGMFASFYTIPLFARTVQSSSATDAGLLLLPAGLMMAFVFPIVGRLIDRMPAYYLILAGQVVFIIATAALSFANKDTSYTMLACWIIAGRIGLGFIMPSNSTYALSIVDPSQVPQASGALNFIRMLGGTVGVNLTAILITALTNLHMTKTGASLEGLAVNDPNAVLAMTRVFEDVFLVTAAIFALSIVPALYITFKDRKKENPAK